MQVNSCMKLLEVTGRLIKNSINWTTSDAADEHDEVAYQLDIGKSSDFPQWVIDRLNELKDFDKFSAAVKQGKVVKLSRKDIENAGNTGDSWKDTVQWTSPEKEKRTPTLFKTGSKVNRPIYLKNSQTGELWLLAGHHRSTYASDVLKQPVEATVI